MNSFRFIFFIPHCEQELCLKNKWKTILMICYRMITDGKCVFFFLSLTSYQMAYKLLLKQKTLKKITFFTLNNPQWLLFIYHNGFCFLLMPIQAIHLLNCWSHWSNLIYHILHTQKKHWERICFLYIWREKIMIKNKLKNIFNDCCIKIKNFFFSFSNHKKFYDLMKNKEWWKKLAIELRILFGFLLY